MSWKTIALIAAIPLAILALYLLQSYGDDESTLPIIVDAAPERPVNKIEREAYKPAPTVGYRDEPFVDEAPLVAPPVSLEGSDVQVKEAVLDFAPAMASWLLPDQQIRKWVLLVDLMAEGKLPRRYRPAKLSHGHLQSG